MLKFEEKRDVYPIRVGDRIVSLAPGPIRTYLRLGPFRLRVPGWVLELATR